MHRLTVGFRHHTIVMLPIPRAFIFMIVARYLSYYLHVILLVLLIIFDQQILTTSTVGVHLS